MLLKKQIGIFFPYFLLDFLFSFLFIEYSLALHHHIQILELLEIPQLMETCVRNEYYEEALELESYVRKLKNRFSSILIFQNIVHFYYFLILL